ncbi:MAG: glucosyltransferase domain-containing protein [Cyanobium sp.]
MAGWTICEARHWFLAFLGLFLAIHWQEVSSPTWNVDDWALIGERIDQAKQSRPAWDLIYPLLFQNSFSPFFGWLLAAGSLYAVAAATAVFCPLITPAWACLLALVLSLHSYTLDLFNFSFAIGTYLLPAALSIWGGVLMAYGPAAPLLGRRWLDWLLGVLMLMVAMGIYQPTGYLAIALLGWQALAWALDQRHFARSAALRLMAGVGVGGVFYYLWALIMMRGEQANSRTGFSDLPRFLEKLTALGVYKEIYNTKVSLASTAPQFILGTMFLLLLLVLSGWVVRRSESRVARRQHLAWLWFAALFLTLLPLFLFYLLRSGFPSRAFCLGNLGIGSFSVIALATLQSSRRGLVWSRLLVGLLIVFYLIPQAAFAARVWELTQLLERRDQAMAQAIAADVRAEARRTGLAADTFELFGTTERNEPFPHWSSVGESVFRQSWSIEAIFRQLLRQPVTHIAYRSEGNEQQVRASLPPCRAYPEPGSIVRHGDRWLVCLEANGSSAEARPGAPGVR